MKNMTVANKILFSFSILLIAFIAFGVFAYHSVSELDKLNTGINQRTTLVANSNRVAQAMQKTRLYIFYQVVSTDPAQKQDFVQKIQDARQDVDDAFNALREAKKNTDFGSPDITKQALSELDAEQELWENYKRMSQAGDAMKKADNREEAESFILAPELVKAFDAAVAGINQDAQNCIRDAAAQKELSQAKESQIAVITIVSLLLVIALTLAVLYWLRREINNSVQGFLQAVRRAAGGDLSVHAPVENQDEFGEMATAFNGMIDNMRSMTKKIQDTAVFVSDTSEQLTANANQSAEATQSVAQSITEVAESAAVQMDSIGETKHEIDALSDGISQAVSRIATIRKNIEDTVERANEGNDLVKSTVEQMNTISETVDQSAQIVEKLGQRSQEIGEIISTISGIAEQTNLLALNAAIEAARAGENGRGFAVVAEEVRKLAEESQQAAQQIGDLISSIQTETEQAVGAMKDGREQAEKGLENVSSTGQGFSRILELIRICSDDSAQITDTMQILDGRIRTIVNLSEDVNNSARRASDASQNVSAATEEQAAGMEEIAASSRGLADSAKNLKEESVKFKV
ncbi:methyl-accepting chemotaxis protein [uncultured Selenomonas sp.]|uniref:methyl-accepting chemotaxis protein n=1 Tax=uncultured Selenomonas sp. TaxID=159275 RepID=UPI0028E25AE4|nr:methyl-accepting chemotaxis protein [uncultured Selenomonas sp.]